MAYATAILIGLAIYNGLMRHYKRCRDQWPSREPLTMRIPLEPLPRLPDQTPRLRQTSRSQQAQAEP